MAVIAIGGVGGGQVSRRVVVVLKEPIVKQETRNKIASLNFGGERCRL